MKSKGTLVLGILIGLVSGALGWSLLSGQTAYAQAERGRRAVGIAIGVNGANHNIAYILHDDGELKEKLLGLAPPPPRAVMSGDPYGHAPREVKKGDPDG